VAIAAAFPSDESIVTLPDWREIDPTDPP